jgi:PiT family inorganic phosphate transporter
MGIIAVLLYANGFLGSDSTCRSGSSSPATPRWARHAHRRWRIVRTMGMRITKLKPVGGFCAETGGAITLFLATHLGVPVSTTHTITGAIVGVGSVTNASAVRWGVAGRIVWAWVLTIPSAAAVAALTWVVLHRLVGV